MTELETKFLLDAGRQPEKALRRLLQDLAWAGFQIHPKTTRLLQDVYFDTPDHRLRRAGWSLRCRHRSLALQLTCKQLSDGSDGYFERREIEQTTLHDSPALETLEDGPVLDLLRRYVPENAELVASFSQTNRRSTWVLTHHEHPRAAIELVMDRVSVDGSRTMNYVEFEGELKQGPIALLEDVAAVAAAHPALTRSRTSKFQRGHFCVHPMMDVGDRRRDLMTPDASWAELAASYLHEQLQALVAYAPFAYEGLHTEGVHQMRVATRRLRAALKAFSDVLPEAPTQALAAEAGWLCDVLGAVRDMDVQLGQLDDYRAAIPPARHASLEAYQAYLRREHHRARCCLKTAMDSGRYRRFLTAYQSLLVEADTARHRASHNVRAFARDFVPKRLNAILKAGRRIDRQTPPAAYHRLRIRIKKLRYGLEILDGPYGAELARASRALRKLQGRLGDHQDACVAQERLADYRENHAGGHREQRTFDQLIRLETDRAAALRRRFPNDWAKLEKEAKKLKRAF